MRTKHTPGPWELVIRNERDGIWGCIGAQSNRDTFCRVDCCNEEKTANARLIAVAPELLNALIGAYRMYQYANAKHTFASMGGDRYIWSSDITTALCRALGLDPDTATHSDLETAIKTKGDSK